MIPPIGIGVVLGETNREKRMHHDLPWMVGYLFIRLWELGAHEKAGRVPGLSSPEMAIYHGKSLMRDYLPRARKGRFE